MAELTQRLRDRVNRDFPPGTSDQVVARLTSLTSEACGGQDRERIQAALVLSSLGKWERFQSALKLLALDWRDVLMAGGLGHENWPDVLNEELDDRP